MSQSDSRPEPWIALALVCAKKSDSSTAILHLDKALTYNQRHLFTHQVKGTLLYEADQFKEALVSFHAAYRISRSLLVYEGLLNCYLKLGNTTTALAKCKDILSTFPKSAHALLIIGRVYSEIPGNFQKALEYLQQSLEIDAKHMDTVFAVSHLHEKNGDIQSAIDFLEKYLDVSYHSELIHVTIAELFTLNGEYEKATMHYNVVLAYTLGNLGAIQTVSVR